MQYSQIIPAFLVSLFASIGGAISGIGGGVVIKPVLDLVNFSDTAVISFLSGVTVLSMSVVTLLRSAKGNSRAELSFRISLFIAIGSVVGGIGGKLVFNKLLLYMESSSVSTTQSVILLVMIAGVILYMLNKKRIRTLHVTNPGVCIAVGLLLGASSSFLGIGGGPINIVILFYLFSMDAKTAALNSIFVILFSQISSLVYLMAGQAVPPFDWPVLLVMVAGGVAGAFIGRALSQKMSHSMVEKLYSCLMVFVAVMCIVNIVR